MKSIIIGLHKKNLINKEIILCKVIKFSQIKKTKKKSNIQVNLLIKLLILL